MIGSLAPKLDIVVIGAKTIIAHRKGEHYLPIGICDLIVSSVSCAVEGVHLNPGFGQTVSILYGYSNGYRHGNSGAITPGQCAMIRCSAPELRAVQVGAETIAALRQGESDLSTRVCGGIVAGIRRSIERVNLQARLRSIIGIRHIHYNWLGDGDIRASTAGNITMIGCAAPKLRAIEIRAETIGPLR